MQDTLPLFTALLSLPTPAQYPSLALTPQKQKEHTLQALLQLVVAQAERQATVLVWEDLHWADPSSLEFLTLLIEQIPTTKLFLVLTFRPEFTPPWKPRSHISQLVLNRLGKRQVEAMIEQVTAGKELAPEIIEQIRLKVEAEILYQRGVGEQARYFFKHALIQDTAYQSLLKSTRQQYHQRIARVLEEQFPDTKDLQEAKALLVELEHRAIRSLKD